MFQHLVQELLWYCKQVKFIEICKLSLIPTNVIDYRFNEIIFGQFFGHYHPDTFKLFYERMGDSSSKLVNIFHGFINIHFLGQPMFSFWDRVFQQNGWVSGQVSIPHIEFIRPIDRRAKFSTLRPSIPIWRNQCPTSNNLNGIDCTELVKSTNSKI